MEFETKQYKGYEIKIYHEEFMDAFHPRHTQDNLGKLVCFHRRYSLGDKGTNEEFPEPEDFREWLEKNKDTLILLPVFMYDHSGICLNTGGFSCPWDSGQVGWIYVTKEEAREWLGLSRLTQKQVERIETILRAEIEEYSDYLQGFVYYYQIYKDGEFEEEVDCCGGFIGMDMEENGLMEHAEATIDSEIAHRQKQKDLREKKLVDAGIDEEMIDTLVHELKDEEATIINNSGRDGQIEYILSRLGTFDKLLETFGVKEVENG